MANLKSLLKDTVIYGLSSIIGRFLNYLLVPLYTAKISAASGGYGVITNVYAYTALLLVLLTFGMETTFFRFANSTHETYVRKWCTRNDARGNENLWSRLFCRPIELYVPGKYRHNILYSGGIFWFGKH